MTECKSTTHYTGCACHEARREEEIERRNQIIADLISGISGACMKMKSPKMGNGHVNDAYEELKMSQRRAISRMNDLEALNGGKKG